MDMTPTIGLSVPDLYSTGSMFSNTAINSKNVIYADFMLMVLSGTQRWAIGVVTIVLLVLAVVGNLTTFWVNMRR